MSRAWERVLNQLESLLLSGELKAGDRLPPERSLATQFNVGRSSVREALRVLEIVGLIRTQSGSGPQSGAMVVATPSDGISTLLRLQVAARGFPVVDVVHTRLILECAVVADLTSTQPDLTQATQLLSAMETDPLDPIDFLVLDASFHVALALATGNQVVSAMMMGLRNSIERYVIEGALKVREWSTLANRLRVEHRGIIGSIYAHDKATAQERVQSHINGYYALIQLADDGD